MMSGSFRAVVAATAATGIGVTTFTPRPLLTITVAAIAVICAWGWPRLVGIPARVPALVVLLSTAVAAVAVVEYVDNVAWLAMVCAGAILLTFIAELFRRDGRPRLVEQVAGTVTGSVIVTSAAGWLAISTSTHSQALVVTAAVAIAVAAVVTIFRLPSLWSTVLAVTLSALAGLAVGTAIEAMTALAGVLVGLTAGLLVATVHHLFDHFPSSPRVVPGLAAALIIVAVTGIPVYILGQVLLPAA